MSRESNAIRRRLRPLVLGALGLAAVAGTGCGEKSEPAIHPPTAAPTTATVPTTPAPRSTTTKQPGSTPTAPVPKTTP